MTIFRKPSPKRFQLWFLTHHKKLVKTDKNQSMIMKKINRVFEEKVNTDCFNSDETLADTKDCLSDTTEVIPKIVGMEFGKL